MAYYIIQLNGDIIVPEWGSHTVNFPECLSVLFTIRTAKQLQPNADLPPIFRVPGQGNQTNMFRCEGVMEDIPLDLIIIPVARQSLQLN